jgi:hypothetical protein
VSQAEPFAEETERRVSTRIPVNERATILLGNAGSAMACTLMDLCLDGCRVRTDGEIRAEAGARVELAFSIDGTGFRLGGVTEWAGTTRELGVLFTGVSPRREAELVEVLGKLAAGGQEKQAERSGAEEALQAARERVQQRTAEFEAKAARETALRAEVESAAREKREAQELLKSAKRELAHAEKAAQQQARVAIAEARPEAQVASAATVTGARAGDGTTLNPPSDAQQMGSPGRERRQAQRHAVDSTATVFLVEVRSNLRGRIVDVSISGCRIRFADRFPVGIYRRVEVEFLLDGLPFRLPGVVQSLHDRFTAGIRFVDLSERKREQLLFVIEEIAEAAGEEGREASGKGTSTAG